MPSMNAALGVAQFEQLPQRPTAKRRLAQRYDGCFARFDRAQSLHEAEGPRSNPQLDTPLLNKDQTHRWDEVLGAPNDAGLETRPIWTRMHRLPIYQSCPRADLSVAEDLAVRVLTLPYHRRSGREP
jgi:perosamine synthetase